MTSRLLAQPVTGAMDVPSMFSPVDLGPVTAPNRLFFAPASVGYAADGVVTSRLVEHYGRRAAGGAGVVMTEHFSVSEEGWQNRRQPAAWPDPAFGPGLGRLAAEIRDNGALAFAQLSHAGRYAGPWEEWAARPRLSASAVPFPLLGSVVSPLEMDTDQIAGVVAAFGASTRFLVDAGFQGFEVHAGFGFLVSSFVSPLMNRRSDAYGGSTAGRVRFAQEVVQACVEAAAGQAVVGIHLMIDELLAGGLTVDDLAVLVPALEEAGVGFFRPGRGTLESLRHPDHARTSYRTDYNRPYADALVDIAQAPILANGGLRTRADVESALAGGAAAVALARPMLTDPDWASKLRSGADDDVVACPDDPALCLRTQMSGTICSAWPAEVQALGFSGYAHHPHAKAIAHPRRDPDERAPVPKKLSTP